MAAVVPPDENNENLFHLNELFANLQSLWVCFQTFIYYYFISVSASVLGVGQDGLSSHSVNQYSCCL